MAARSCERIVPADSPRRRAWAVTISIDYRFDTSNFFGAGNPDGPAAGQQAKASLEAAASFFSNIQAVPGADWSIAVPPSKDRVRGRRK